MKSNQANFPIFQISIFFFLSFITYLPTISAQEMWSNPNTWGGTKPVVGENVTIPSGTHIILDEDTSDLGGLTIEGKLEFADQDLNLTADWIMLMGTMEVGTFDSPYAHQAVITLNANDPNQSIMNMGTRGIMVMGGSLEMHGVAPTIPWTKINAEAPEGSTNLTLMETVNWQSNDEIIVGPTDFYQAANGNSITQKVNLTNVNGTQLGLSEGLNAHRWGQLQYATHTGMSLTQNNMVTPPANEGFTPTILDERAPVGNLTRNIVIQAPNDALWQNQGFGVHIMVMRVGAGMGTMCAVTMGCAHLDGVEIRRGGQRGELGRYPFHWHMLSYEGTETLPDAAGQYIRNSVINESMNRGIVIHGTNGVEVADNIVYKVRGHGIFTEDASERRNVIDGNLVLHVRNPENGYGLKIHETGENAGRGSSGFWISNPDNTVTNNMAGDSDTNGFWLAFPENTWGLSADIDMRPDRLRFGIFENNTAHSNGSEGINLDWVEVDTEGGISPSKYISTTDGQDPQWPFPNKRRFLLKGLSVWKNAGSGLWDRSDWADNQEIVNADNSFSYFAGAGEFGVIERSLVVGNSLNHLMNGTDRNDLVWSLPPAAFATYHSTFDIKDNIVLDMPAEESYSSGVFATNDYYIRGVEKGQIRNTNNLIINSHPGIKLEAHEPQFALAGALWDPHGNWGGNPGDYLVYDSPFFTHGQTPTIVNPNPDFSGGVLVEGPFYEVDGFVVNQGNESWGAFMEIAVTRFDENWNTVDTWSVAEGYEYDLLPNMRHFAAHPDGYYQLDFPAIEDVTDLAFSVTNMLTTDDYQVLGFEYSGDYQVDQIYFTTYANHFNYGFPDEPESEDKQIYQAAVNRQAVIDSPNGKTYWHDRTNSTIWVKIQGGAYTGWQPGDYAEDSDEVIYRESYLRVYGSEATTLAVELSDFAATLQADRTVKIDWTTTTETNHDYFVIQRSADGLHWEDVQKINNNGNSNAQQKRSIIDRRPLAGISYYRLKQVDIQALVTYSSVAIVNRTMKEETVQLFPNPATETVQIDLGQLSSDTEIFITDMKGQVMLQQFYQQIEKIDLDISHLPTGIYLVKCKTSNGMTSLKLVVDK